ncbi:MAG TPA: T9SS type A sorting domain-containing protein [Acidobacteriota bacterium]|nr:T9SS type A sorting domain-containing protein [Acidobacteriota bacterium]
MRRLKIPILTALILLAFTGLSRAQDHLGCDDLTKSTIDTVRVVSTEGKPGEIVDMPIRMKNDSICTAFQILIQFDTTWLTPVFIRDSTCSEADTLGNCIVWSVDSNFVDYVIHDPRFLKTDTSGPFNDIIDTVTNFTASFFQGKEDVIACNFLPQFTKIDSLAGGADAIFSLRFMVDENMPHHALAEFILFEIDIFVVDSPLGIPDTTYFDGCNSTQLTTAWFTGVETQTFQVFPTTNTSTPMFFRADTGFVPTDDPTISLTAFPTTVSPGGQSNLNWLATNADTVILYGPSSAVLLATPTMSGTFPVTLPTTEGSYQYSATAKQNTGKTATSYATVTVSAGGGGDGPVITFVPADVSYRINQGETVSFTVEAAEGDGDQVTLTASSLPNNAAFAPTNPVIGIGSVSGTFSFTPDFNQEGSFVVSFTAEDKDGSTTRSVTIMVDKLQVDRLFSTSAPGQKPVGGLRGTGGIYFPINLVTSKTVYGVQFDMLYPSTIVTVDSFVTTGRIPEYVVYDNIGQVPGEVRVLAFGLANEPVGSDTTTAILWAVMTLDEDAVPWSTHTIYLQNGRESVSPDPNIGSLPLVTDSGVVEIDNPGDVNLDKFIDVDDAVGIVSSIIETFLLTRRQFDVADVIENDSVNVFDLVGVVNLIYGIPLAPSPTPSFPGDTALILLAFEDMARGSSDIVTVASEGIPEQLAGVQLEVSYDPSAVSLGAPSLTRDNERFALSYKDNGNGRMTIVLYHMAPLKTDELIQAGGADLVYIPAIARTDIKSGDRTRIRVTDAMLSTASAASVNVSGVDRSGISGLPGTFVLEQNYPNPFNPETRIAFSLSHAAHVKLTIFNVLGQHVRSLIDGPMDTGEEHEVVWDATDDLGRRVASGIYLYRLKVGDENQTKKMLFLK